MTDLYVKLDDLGHVCGQTNARIGPGWIKPPAEVAADPFRFRVDETGWTDKTSEDVQAFEAFHSRPLPEPATKARLRKVLRDGIGHDRDKQLTMLHALAEAVLSD